MKTLFTLIATLFIGHAIYAQGCTELFFSEYCEGSGNNKGLEIYNPTTEAIDLSDYTVQRYSNGAQAASDETSLVGTIQPYGTFVIVNGQTEDVDLGGGQISPAVDPEMQNYADQLDNPYPAPTYMNGNDAIVLLKGTNIIVDIFGKPGQDPGVAWTDNEEAGYTDSDGGAWLTANKTLRRKSTVTDGVTSVPVLFNTFVEWDSLPSNTWDGLGVHFCLCDPNFVENEEIEIDFNIFPNPSTEGRINLTSNLSIEKVELFDQSGRKVAEEVFTGSQRNVVVLTDELEKGIYVVNALLEGRKTFSQRVVIR